VNPHASERSKGHVEAAPVRRASHLAALRPGPRDAPRGPYTRSPPLPCERTVKKTLKAELSATDERLERQLL